MLRTYFGLTLFSIMVVACAGVCTDDDVYIIRHGFSGLVLDARNSRKIQVQHFNGYSTQLWKFERGLKIGLFYIISNYTGNVLGYRSHDRSLLLAEKEDSLDQQWRVTWNDRIFNEGKKNYTIDVTDANYTAGNYVQVWPNNLTPAQEFTFEKKI